jgi:hypothetical protein
VVYLRIRNTGRSAATGLDVRVDRDFFQFGDAKPERNIRTFHAFSGTIESMPPGSQLIFALAQGFVIHGEKADGTVTPKEFVVSARYSQGDRTFVEKTHVDLRPFAQSVPPPDPLIEKLDEIKRELHKK